MPHDDFWETSGLHRKYRGTIETDEILQANLELPSHPQFSEIAYIISDFSEISGVSFNNNHTKIFALTDDIMSVTKGKLKIALVVNNKKYIDLAHNYRKELKNKFYICEIFQTVGDARKWVGE